jgi:hypothetical protein
VVALTLNGDAMALKRENSQSTWGYMKGGPFVRVRCMAANSVRQKLDGFWEPRNPKSQELLPKTIMEMGRALDITGYFATGGTSYCVWIEGPEEIPDDDASTPSASQ